MKGIKGLLCSTNMSEQDQEQAMDVNPPPHPNLLQAGQAGTSGEGENPRKSPTKNYRFYWAEKLDNSYATKTPTARKISILDNQLGIGVPRKRKTIDPHHLIK